tara:strand:+ start:5146 stop:5970 length:825 start_codon:yes stop_codon:yes gene_type:complete
MLLVKVKNAKLLLLTMGVLNFFERFFGGLFISLGIALLIFTLISSGLSEGLDNIDPILEDMVEEFMTANAEQMIEYTLEEEYGEVDWDEINQACDDGLMDEADCEQMDALQSGNLSAFFGDELDEQTQVMVDGFKEPLMELFGPVHDVHDSRFIIYSIVILLLCVGSVLVFLGVERDLLRLASRLGWSVGLSCLGWGVALWYVSQMDSSILDSVNIEGPEFMLDLILDMLIGLVRPAIEPLITPLFYFAVVGLAIGIGFLVYRIVFWFKHRKKK